MDINNNVLDSDAFNRLVKGRDGWFLYNKNDIYVGRSLAELGEYSKDEMDVMRSLCQPGDTVIEVGANMGAHTVGLAKHVGEQGRVLAFEPQRMMFQLLCANVAINSLSNVECYWAALADQSGTLSVPEPDPAIKRNFGGVSLFVEQEKVENFMQVSCYTMDVFAERPGITLLKIDAEGSEVHVIKGAEKLIGKFKPRIYIENDRANYKQLMEMISGLGYRMYWNLPPMYNRDNYFANDNNIFGEPSIVSLNMICLHRDSGERLENCDEIVDFNLHPIKQQ